MRFFAVRCTSVATMHRGGGQLLVCANVNLIWRPVRVCVAVTSIRRVLAPWLLIADCDKATSDTATRKVEAISQEPSTGRLPMSAGVDVDGVAMAVFEEQAGVTASFESIRRAGPSTRHFCNKVRVESSSSVLSNATSTREDGCGPPSTPNSNDEPPLPPHIG